MSYRHGFTLLCLLVCSTFSWGRDYWPGWLGPERDGWVADFEPPASWPKELNVVWQVEVGTGYSSPLVIGGSVYQQARLGQEEVVWCFDLDSGNVKWRESHSVPFKMGGGGEWHGKGPKSCPIYADGRIFTLSISGILSAWNAANGELIWRRDYSARFEKTNPYWGATTSPIVADDRVVVHFGNDDEGVLVALHVETGEEVWTQGNDGASYSSPLLVEISDVRQIVEWNHNSLVGVDVGTGKLLWTQAFPHEATNQNMPTPTYYQGNVFLGGENRGLHCYRPKFEDGLWTVSELWHQKDVALDMSSAVVNDGKLYGFSHYNKGQLFCVDTVSGDVLWEGPKRTGSNVTFLCSEGLVYALLDTGELQVLEATGEKYSQVVSYKVAENPTWAPPVLLRDGFLVKDQHSLIRWSFKR